MDIGQFDKTVIFKSNTISTTSSGGRADGYSTLCTVYGWLKKDGSSRALEFGETNFNNSYTLVVEYQETINSAIRPDLKVEIDSVTYTISGWEKIEERRYFLKFKLERQDG
jgi:head-tail adaptor